MPAWQCGDPSAGHLTALDEFLAGRTDAERAAFTCYHGLADGKPGDHSAAVRLLMPHYASLAGQPAFGTVQIRLDELEQELQLRVERAEHGENEASPT